MEDSTLFRSATPPVDATSNPQEGQSSVSDTTPAHSDLPPSLYIEANKPPLVLDLIGGSSAYTHFDMKPLSQEIDRYIGEEILRQGLADTKEDYQLVLDEALKTLKLPEGVDVYAMVEKLVRHFRIQHKLYSALREKEELMAADPLTLSAAKLKLYIERHA